MSAPEELYEKVAEAVQALQAAQQTVTNAVAQLRTSVHLTGDETIGGIKTFTLSPLVPTAIAGDNSSKVANTAFVTNACVTMRGASASAAGSRGMVPPPAKGQQGSFLRGDGTWAAPADMDTHCTTKLIAGVSNSTANAAATNGNLYIRLFDDSTARNSINIKGTGLTKVTSNANGVITIDTTYEGTTYSVMTGASATTNGTQGLVPAPGIGKQASFLRGDGTWVVPTNTTYNVMTGASSTAAGAQGLVPAPAKGDQAKFLRADGTWVVPTNTTYSDATTSASGLMTAADKTKLNGITAAATAVSFAASQTSGTLIGTITINGTAHKIYVPPYVDGGSTVAFSATQTSGTVVGKLTIDGTETTLYAPTPVTYTAGTGLSLSGTSFAISSSGVTAGTYGPTENVAPAYAASFSVPTFTVDATGRVTSAGTKTVTLPAAPESPKTYTGTSPIVVSGTEITHGTSGVTAGSYGPSANATPNYSATFNVPYITVDAKGHVTAASTKTVKLPAASSYTLPSATSSTLGGVKVGSNITVSSGTISLTKSNVTSALGYTPPQNVSTTTYSAGTGLALSGTTFSIDGSQILNWTAGSGSTASAWFNNNIGIYMGTSSNITGHIYFNNSRNGSDMGTNGQIRYGRNSTAYSVGFFINNGNGVSLWNDGSKTAFTSDSSNTVQLGSATQKWIEVFATTGTISTSDARAKQAIDSIPDSILDAWENVSWRQFQFNDAVEEKGNAKARLHTGLVAQEVDSVFETAGIDASRYGFFCHDEWDAAEEVTTEDDGAIVQKAREAGDSYSMRYEEALCIEAAYQRRRADRFEQALLELTERVKALESK